MGLVRLAAGAGSVPLMGCSCPARCQYPRDLLHVLGKARGWLLSGYRVVLSQHREGVTSLAGCTMQGTETRGTKPTSIA